MAKKTETAVPPGRGNERTLRWTDLPGGRVVSTVRMFGGNLAGIPRGMLGHDYETMVFEDDNCFGELDCDRYNTEEAAILGHEAMVERWKKEE